MAHKTMTFTIGKDGNTTLKDVCGMGADCQQFTKKVEDRLGAADEGSREDTDSRYVKMDGTQIQIGDGEGDEPHGS